MTSVRKETSSEGGREREIRSSATRRQPGQEPFATRLLAGVQRQEQDAFPTRKVGISLDPLLSRYGGGEPDA